MEKMHLSLVRIKERAVHTSRRASYLIEIRSRDMDNKKLGNLTAKACSLSYKWLIIYEERTKEERIKRASLE